MNTLLRLPLLLLVLCLAACQGTLVRNELVGVKQRIDTARQNGAYLCAPRELALAESNYDFAVADLDYGAYFPAREHADQAAKNANLAFEKSPRAYCSYSPTPPPPKLVPKIGDRDGDGILDNVDKCPTEPEDKDGFEDEDGCPDPDNDKDGILDADDQCPTQAGPKENKGCPDTDKDGDTVVDRLDKCPDVAGPPPTGCPAPPRKFIVVTAEKIELKQKIHFATNKSRIFPDSFPLLNEVVEVLKSRPAMELRIEGHTDNKGKPKKNQKLSVDRANAVRDFLVKAGVPTERLQAEGFGQDKPIGNNKTAAGREQNRRTEFFILKQ